MTTKTLDDMTPTDWTLYEWVEVTAEGDLRRTFTKGQERTPSEALLADTEWDTWLSAKRLEYAMRKANDQENI
jgi:hypothetical protein